MLACTDLLDMPLWRIEARLADARSDYADYVGPGGVVKDVDYAESLLARVVLYERLLARSSRPGR